MPGTTICGLADGAGWPVKNAIRKFRGEFEEYIKRTNPHGYMVTEAVRHCRCSATKMPACNRLRDTTSEQSTADHVMRESTMPIVIVDGNEVELADRRAAQRHSGRRAGRRRHSALLLASGPDGRGQLPHVPGRDRHAQCRRPARSRCSPSSCPPARRRPRTARSSSPTARRSQRSRAMVEEDLLLDHPIDCPICDKAGECCLQDYHFEYGQDERRADIRPFTSRRREMGDTVTLFVDRCVMCSPLRALHARDQRHERADGHQPRQPRRDRRRCPAIRWTTSCRATWSISARSGRWATRIFCTSSASGS